MTYIIVIFLTYVLMLLLKLNIISTLIIFVFIMLMQHFHRKKSRSFKLEQRRFQDVSLYIDTLLYSFLKEKKIMRAFEDVKSTLEDGRMKEVVSEALEHMLVTFDETEVLVDSMKIVEREYNCSRIVNIHEFMAHSEYYGGDITESAKILLKDKSAWEKRIQQSIHERQMMFRQVILSVVVSLIICGIILYLPIMNMDISSNPIVQVLSVIVVVLDDFIILAGQRYLAVDYLRLDMLTDDKKYAKKLIEYKEYSPKKERRLSIALAVVPLAVSVYLLFTNRKWAAAVGFAIALVMANQHSIGHSLMKKNIVTQVKCAFPKWLMDIALLIQSENVQVAIAKSKEHLPGVLKDEVASLIERLDIEPESSTPYHRFLDYLRLPEINAAMGMLYAISIGSSENSGSQIDELISKNLEMLDIADTQRLKDKTSGMYLLFLAPVVTASFKMIADMAIFLLSFLAYKVV